ncbi:C1 family peptidase [Luteitalea sp.]|uniref:C1 family peptidase n=1 Tax=Luteitalea sp. TaxID=2004800 RepID=UPI0025C63FEB|nr:C1 family peptidase [Luteitalea sp.]
MSQRVFDARPDRADFRDLPYRPPLRSLPPVWPTPADLKRLLPSYVKAGLVLDQGTEGACTGFGLACVANYLLWMRRGTARSKFAPVSPRMLYELAKHYDEWPGEKYEGSSCRGALKGWHKHGVCASKYWPYPFNQAGEAVFVPPAKEWSADALARTLGVYYRVERSSVIDLQAAIVNIGAVYVSARVHAGWDTLAGSRARRAPTSHKEVAEIPIPAKLGPLGGHAFALVGYDERGFIVQNSWGARWGSGGFARLTYEDWVAHGTDAWACALGVPAVESKARARTIRWHVPSGRALVTLDRAQGSPNNPSDDPWPFDHEFLFKEYEPISTASAYEHTLVTGNDGEVVVRDVTKGGPSGAADCVRELALELPLAWLKKRPEATVKLALYAHGGLNAEDGAIQRNRVLAPYFTANGIYPLFVAWRTGFGETIGSLVEDWLRKIPGFDTDRATGFGEWLSDQRDRAIELVARPLGRGIWGEMRENAERSTRAGHGLDLLARNLDQLRARLAAQGKTLELHLAGHSAGAILLGHLLERAMMPGAPTLPKIGTCTLFAPACSVGFANQHYGAADAAGLLKLEKLWINCLQDNIEKRDALPSPGKPIYGKSLLYMVSRALDDSRKMPILGLERVHLPKYVNDDDQWADSRLADVKAWQAMWLGRGGSARTNVIPDQDVPYTRIGGRTQATHGSFDNNIAVWTTTLERMSGRQLAKPMEWLDF